MENNQQVKKVWLRDRPYSLPRVWHNLPPSILAEHIMARNEGVMADNGAIVCRTGKFTGRCPQDRFIVKDDTTADILNWGAVNQPFSPQQFDHLTQKMMAALSCQELYMSDVIASAPYKLKLRVISTTAYHSLFVQNMFMAADDSDLTPDMLVLVDPNFTAEPRQDGTRSEHFILLSLADRLLCIGGTGYTGEVKKGVFTLLNYLLPHEHKVLTMHCGANLGRNTALFFGLSGTGKTTLSSDPARQLIGDDEHGWDQRGIFNIEGGCYAKVINITEQQEPLIWHAIKPYALLENTILKDNKVDYTDTRITENTRVSYPLNHVSGRVTDIYSPHPRDIFFLSCDAFGVLPPLSLLNDDQALFYFLCGYTAKIAGTEQGIKQPTAAFSNCFAAPFIPLPPRVYADMLMARLKKHKVRVWLVNTGWIGGAYGSNAGRRIDLAYTRALLDAAINDKLDLATMRHHPIFDLAMPSSCPSVPQDVLDPIILWHDKADYQQQAQRLKNMLSEQGQQHMGHTTAKSAVMV